MSDDIRKIYKNLGVKCDGVLVFGDTVQRPWGLGFGDDFINERIYRANKYTRDMIEKYVTFCCSMYCPMANNKWNLIFSRVIVLSKHEMVDDQQTLMEWISIYVDEYVTDMDSTSDNTSKITDIKAQSLGDELHENALFPIGDIKQYGIWSEVDGINE